MMVRFMYCRGKRALEVRRRQPPQLHRTVRAIDAGGREGFEQLWRRLDLSVDWSMTYYARRLHKVIAGYSMRSHHSSAIAKRRCVAAVDFESHPTGCTQLDQQE